VVYSFFGLSVVLFAALALDAREVTAIGMDGTAKRSAGALSPRGGFETLLFRTVIEFTFNNLFQIDNPREAGALILLSLVKKD